MNIKNNIEDLQLKARIGSVLLKIHTVAAINGEMLTAEMVEEEMIKELSNSEGSTLVSPIIAAARLRVCQTFNNGSPCSFFGTVTHNGITGVGCTACTCYLAVKSQFDEIKGIAKSVKIRCGAIEKGYSDRWAENTPLMQKNLSESNA